MSGESSSLSVLADATANRLRMLQSQLADDTAEGRAAALYQEVREAVGKILPEHRREFLDALQERFPTFGDGLPADIAPAAESEPLDNRSPLQMLEEQATTMTPLQKQETADRLRRAGFPLAAPAQLPEHEARELSRLLQLPADAKPDPSRTVQLLMLLTEFASQLDPVSWGSWATIDPESEIRKPGPLARMMGQFLLGNTTREQLRNDSSRLLRLTAMLVLAVQKISPNLFRNCFDPIAPATIRQRIKPRPLANVKAQCWEEYETLAGTMDPGWLEKELYSAVSRFVRDGLGQMPSQPHPGQPPRGQSQA